MIHIHGAEFIAMLLLAPCALGQAQLGVKREYTDKSGNPACAYRRSDGFHILKQAESLKDTSYAVDNTGKVRELPEVVTCRKTDRGLALDFAWTLDGQPALLYRVVRQDSVASLAALRAGESFQDAFYVYTADEKVKQLPVKVTCLKRGAVIELQVTATLDGEPVEFYADAQGRWIALRRGEHLAGASKLNLAETRLWRGLE